MSEVYLNATSAQLFNTLASWAPAQHWSLECQWTVSLPESQIFPLLHMAVKNQFYTPGCSVEIKAHVETWSSHRPTHSHSGCLESESRSPCRSHRRAPRWFTLAEQILLQREFIDQWAASFCLPHSIKQEKLWALHWNWRYNHIAKTTKHIYRLVFFFIPIFLTGVWTLHSSMTAAVQQIFFLLVLNKLSTVTLKNKHLMLTIKRRDGGGVLVHRGAAGWRSTIQKLSIKYWTHQLLFPFVWLRLKIP